MDLEIDDSGVNFIYSFFGGPVPQNQAEQIEPLNTPQHRVSNTPARVLENVEGNTEKPTENTEFDQNRFEDLEEFMREEEVMQG